MTSYYMIIKVLFTCKCFVTVNTANYTITSYLGMFSHTSTKSTIISYLGMFCT
ncbi:unnamed protein product [Callosobruchus maculatus]|uniref:Uncharacterized protein n=1 Tax=Callosobruchus maculatus TaxID=64391 RepID=A0A653CMV4_CALMS|nr:unnamed protein product [Callosobruchus maculatus]